MSPISAIRVAPPVLEDAARLAAAGTRAVPGSPGQIEAPGALTATPSVAQTPASGGFSDMLGRLVSEVNGKQVAAGEAVHQLQSGGNVSLHQTVIAMEEASVAFMLMVEVRNKLMSRTRR
jgi:flagellar hook-basal body complex protein FliE